MFGSAAPAKRSRIAAKMSLGRRVERASTENVLGKLCCEWKSRAFAAPGPDQEGATTLGKQFFEFHYCVGEWLPWCTTRDLGQ